MVRLYLHSNRLARLERGTFIGLNNLKSLHLHSNPIQDICITAFKGLLESLARLSLAFTSLTSLSSRMFEYLPGLKLIDLYRTPLHCDCSLQWLSRVHHNFSIFISSHAICASPSEHINKPATDLSIYRDCTQDLSYQCFNRSISYPSGSSCRDTLDTYCRVFSRGGARGNCPPSKLFCPPPLIITLLFPNSSVSASTCPPPPYTCNLSICPPFQTILEKSLVILLCASAGRGSV